MERMNKTLHKCRLQKANMWVTVKISIAVIPISFFPRMTLFWHHVVDRETKTAETLFFDTIKKIIERTKYRFLLTAVKLVCT